MSIKVMTMVWDGYPGAGSELLAMLALADWCDDRGGSLYPSVKAVGDKIRVGENHARKILRKFEQDRFLAVVGNHNGGKPGTTREYRINVTKLKTLADACNARRDAEKSDKYASGKRSGEAWDDVFATAHLQDTPVQQDAPTAHPQDTPTAPLQHRDGPSAAPETAPLQVGLSTIEPSVEPPVIPLPMATPPAPPAKPADPVDPVDTELQAACRATWKAYADAYTVRYGIGPVRNAQVNAKFKQFVQRVGHDEAPSIAAFFVDSIEDALVLRQCHAVGLLLQGAEAYRMQWATGRKGIAAAMTANRQALSFAERDELARHKRYEEMTGRKWPTDGADVIDITPTNKRIAS